MQPLISKFPIKEFYRGALTNGVTSEMKCLPGLNSLVFFDYSEMAKGTRYCFERADISADNNHTLKKMHEVGLVNPIILRVMQKTALNKDRIAVITAFSSLTDLIASSI
ncbi:hypothetical protein WICPIJ_002726 [Wickerhamomyces pijperi]|uniref:DNA2/NAM7 helicase-like C-terminal domain-containing protein n=1 Tax=Wickerhamomyces pijperi TaxID=599730 RepID=A0A9P8TPJ7_WICPI|nr:hypothetical protein WICPIJ_002726 [Wickerhamomyces pijperi]